MSSILNATYANGYVSARDPYDFVGGEMVRALGMTYRPGDSRAWKQKGRTAFGTALASNSIKGLALCLFDDGTDKLVAYAGTALYGATPGASGTFSSIATGLSASGTVLASCHQQDRWYLGNGYDRNRVLKSDGTVRLHGLQSPATAPTGVPSAAAGSNASPTASSGNFSNPTYAYDGNGSTFASGTVQGASFSRSHTWTTWGSSTDANRSLGVSWWLAGLPSSGDSGDLSGSIGTGGTTSAGFNITVKFEKSENAGSSWTTLLERTYTSVPAGVQSFKSTLAANSNLVHFRATATYNSGTTPGTLQVHTVTIHTGSATANFSTTDGVYYAVTWYNATDGMEGPPSPFSSVVTLSTQNQVLVTRPSDPEAAATHWNLYRVADGQPDTIASAGRLATILIAESTYLDDFSTPATDSLPTSLPLTTIGALNFPRDSAPPAFEFMWVHEASIVGLSRDFPRTMFYSEAGFPESFPEVYVIPAYALDEHDRLLCGVSLGRTTVAFAEGAVLSVTGLPRAIDGQYDAGQALPLKGHPGCVGRYAMTPYSVEGEARAAWVSPFGIYTTNGETCAPLYLDLDWEAEVNEATLSTAVLRWDSKLLRLIFEFDSDGDGVNDREAFIHMAHIKQNGQPKWSQPTPKKISCLVSGLVSGVYRRYSGHPSDGVVYLEESGWTDAATGLAVATDLETGELSGDRSDSACIKANLRHSDWGEGATGTLTVTVLYPEGESEAVAETISLEGRRGHEMMVARAGERFQFRFQNSSDDGGAILVVEAEMERQGRSGSAPKWQTG